MDHLSLPVGPPATDSSSLSPVLGVADACGADAMSAHVLGALLNRCPILETLALSNCSGVDAVREPTALQQSELAFIFSEQT
eukprot:SAG11_NODE_3132_length_2664_cov_1.502924_3_plen_82_part_00